MLIPHSEQLGIQPNHYSCAHCPSVHPLRGRHLHQRMALGQDAGAVPACRLPDLHRHYRQRDCDRDHGGRPTLRRHDAPT